MRGLITPKQESFLMRLARERGLEDEIAAWLSEEDNATKSAASKKIDELLKMPKPRLPSQGIRFDIPEGRYAVEENGDVTFLRIDVPDEENPKWHGWMFVKRQEGDNFRRIGRQPPDRPYSGSMVKQLKDIEADPKAASLRYGVLLGVCGVCGRTLTDEESRAKGIGPICEKKMRWG